jgi:hypothetical protein
MENANNMMMQNGMPPPHMNTMQRPQPGNGQQQIPARIMAHLSATLPELGDGWQKTFDLRQRANCIMQL